MSATIFTTVFSTAMHVLFRCGVSRKKEEAVALLGHSFEGIGVTDDDAAYKSLFSQHQLCWAHLIRKAIKLALQHPTNNRSERNVRREAEIRKGARTSKSESGAHRRSVIVTVFASLQTRMGNFTLASLLGEVNQWLENQCSIFEQELHHLKNPNAPPPAASG